jgi:hypothetical protein
MAKVQILVLCAVAATVSVASSVTSKGSNAVEVNVAAITVATIDGDFEDNYNRAYDFPPFIANCASPVDCQ